MSRKSVRSFPSADNKECVLSRRVRRAHVVRSRLYRHLRIVSARSQDLGCEREPRRARRARRRVRTPRRGRSRARLRLPVAPLRRPIRGQAHRLQRRGRRPAVGRDRPHPPGGRGPRVARPPHYACGMEPSRHSNKCLFTVYERVRVH